LFSLVWLSLFLGPAVGSAEIETPTVNDPDLQLTLFAAEPDIGTPVGIANAAVFSSSNHTRIFPNRIIRDPNVTGSKSSRTQMAMENRTGFRPLPTIFITR
jgi:hypothetical protein